MRIKDILTHILLCSIICYWGVSTANTTEDTFTVGLPCTEEGWYGKTCEDETIEIPNGRPIYALLVSGFHQNSNLDMFHFYNFARCLQEKGAYVHYAWWNNLLAPYMEKPLHNAGSVPSTASIPLDDLSGFILNNGILFPDVPTKAIPAEDHQFQQDAEALLTEIHANNPDAAIILVGHSMGGGAIARLAENTDIDIALLAPIDPVGNRTCLATTESDMGEERAWDNTLCNGSWNFKRYYAVHKDWFTFPAHREFGTNIKYLYHRWQQEGQPPFDFGCPGTIGCLADSQYYFDHPAQRVTSIHGTSTNVQSIVPTSLLSGHDVYPPVAWSPNPFGIADGHGEIVGFRGGTVAIQNWELSIESWPLALDARGDWPRGEGCGVNESDAECRAYHLKKWEDDPDYLRDKGFEPIDPDFCMVSDNLCKILSTKLNLPVNSAPVADAGPDQIVECSGPNGTEVTLDGSGSTDSNDDLLTFTWDWPDGTMMGETMYTYLPVGTHSITLTVDDGNGNTDTDTVDVTVMDSTPPSLSVSLSPDVLWPANHKMVSITASIQASDSCDESPNVELVSIISNEADNGVGDGNTSDDIQGAGFGTDDWTFSLRADRAGKGPGRIYTVTYGATDASGNVAEDATAEITVLHDRGKKSK
jgi:pimeloyl-ACP methyl ester carboxylesterase